MELRGPTIGHLQAWRLRKTSGLVPVQTKGLRTRGAAVSLKTTNQEHQCPKAGVGCPSSHKRANPPFLCLFCSNQALKGLDDDHLHLRGRSSLSLQIGILISSGDALIDTPRNNVSPAIWAFLSPVKLTHKINHHNDRPIWPCIGK